MNRSEPTETPQLEITQDDLDRLADDARDKLFEAFKFWRDAISRASFNSGWDRGYKRGWDRAHATILKRLESATPAVPVAGNAPAKIEQAMLDFTEVTLPAADRVLDYINRYPGKRGVDIANHFASTHPPIPERTIRTALHRMKGKKITIVDGAWHPLKNAEIEAGP